MSEIRQRLVENTTESQDESKADGTADEEEDLSRGPDLSDNSALPQASDSTTEAINTALKDFTPRWRNYIIRGIFSWVMIFSFAGIIYLGPLALVLLVLAIQIKCFHEIISIGYHVYKSYDLPWFRLLSWYFLFASNYFFYGESMTETFGLLLWKSSFLQPLVTYHRFISFFLYVGGIVGFVFSLVKKHYFKQFTLFGWTHVTLLLVVTQSHLIVQNIFEGLIWFLVAVSAIICNDIMAYMFGFFFGRTPLIKLSPKKTWEGFIGGAFATIIFSIVMSWILVQFDYFVCPISYDQDEEALSMECERNPVFVLTYYNLPKLVQWIFGVFHIPWRTISTCPFLLHSICLSLFASIIGPFGGFFASGFKRAFKIKDFGDTIPGHGGLMDRFDCQLLMATFVHVYHFSFIRTPNPGKILQHLFALRPDEQLHVFLMLKDKLINRGLLNSTNL